MYTQVSVCTHKYLYVYTSICMYIQVSTCTHMYLYVHTRICMYTQVSACTHTYLHVHISICMYTHVSACTPITQPRAICSELRLHLCDGIVEMTDTPIETLSRSRASGSCVEKLLYTPSDRETEQSFNNIQQHLYSHVQHGQYTTHSSLYNFTV